MVVFAEHAELEASMSASFNGAWSSLFSSFTEQKKSWHTSTQPYNAAHHAEYEAAVDTAADMHQSAAFTALFDDMISSQSYDAYTLDHQPQVASAQSSVASLCDSATSFSFKTARHDRTDSFKPVTADTAQPCLTAEQLDSSPLAHAHSKVSGAARTDLSATLKDWQTGRDTQHALDHKPAVQEQSEHGLQADATKGTMSDAGRACGHDLSADHAGRRLSTHLPFAVAACQATKKAALGPCTAQLPSRQVKTQAKDRKHKCQQGTAYSSALTPHCSSVADYTHVCTVCYPSDSLHMIWI